MNFKYLKFFVKIKIKQWHILKQCVQVILNEINWPYKIPLKAEEL